MGESQPPKLSKADKLALIVTHLQTSGTCYTLKELETRLPAVASINSIQVKEYIQALIDEDRIRVDKIGSGNWYWSFGSDEKVERERQLARVYTEVEKAKKSCTEWEAALDAANARRNQSDEEDEVGIDTRQSLLVAKAELAAEVQRLRVAETELGNSGSKKGVLMLQGQLAGFRQQALQWTDNLYILEQYVRELAGGDPQMVAAVLHECYGDEYVEGGLRELE